MLNREWALFCVALLLWPLSARTVCAFQVQTGSGTTTPKEAIAEIPTGAVVEVKLHKKPKARGRLVAVTDSSLELQQVEGRGTARKPLAFEDVRSVKLVHRPESARIKVSLNEPGPAAKERIATIRDGAIVEVKLHKQPKVRGRLGAVTDSGFAVQHLKDGSLRTETFAFQDVKSVKTLGHPMSGGKKVLIGVAIVAGTLFGIMALLVAMGYDGPS